MTQPRLLEDEAGPILLSAVMFVGTAICGALLGLVPALFMAAFLVLLPVVISLALVWRFCVGTRGRDLRDLERSHATDAPALAIAWRSLHE